MSDPPEKESELWKQALADVTPLQQGPRIRPEPKPINRADRSRADEAQVMQDALRDYIEPEDFDTGDETDFRRSGVSRQQLRQLRRGRYAIQGSIDLHGKTRAEAAHSVKQFLDTALDHGWRCVKIIHGKGLRSPGGRPILKTRVEISLRHHDQVLAYASAPPWTGGHGAMLVLLRQQS